MESEDSTHTRYESHMNIKNSCHLNDSVFYLIATYRFIFCWNNKSLKNSSVELGSMSLLIGSLKESAEFIAPYTLPDMEVKVSRDLFSQSMTSWTMTSWNRRQKDPFHSYLVLGTKRSYFENLRVAEQSSVTQEVFHKSKADLRCWLAIAWSHSVFFISREDNEFVQVRIWESS